MSYQSVGTYPLVMIPAFAVPLSLVLHGLSLWQLHRTTRRTPAVAYGVASLARTSTGA